MVAIFVKDCNTISQEIYDRTINNINFSSLKCTCGHTGCLTRHAYYTRTVRFKSAAVVLTILRVKCKQCGKTHAVLLSSIVDYLVKPSCLVIDEIGRCTFDKENTRLFFDLIDRRYSKDGANNTIFTSNKQPDVWNEFFTENSSLLCALDRIFDDASVFIIKGESYRGKKLETIKLEAGTALLQAQTK